MKKFFKIISIFIACVFGVAVIAGIAGNFYFGDLNVPDWIAKIKDGINGDKPGDHTHTYTETVVQATCTTQGYMLYECECGESYKSDYTEMIAHNYVCTDCGSVENGIEPCVVALPSIKMMCPECGSYDFTITSNKSATCMSNGVSGGMCSACGYVSSTTTPALGHDYVDYVCTRCGAVDPDKPAEHTHTYTEAVIQATCTTQGYTLYECECGESYQDDYTEMTAHRYVCTECGAEKDENSGDNSVAYPLTVDYLPYKVRYDEL